MSKATMTTDTDRSISFHRCQLQIGGTGERQAGPGRLLGHLVRALANVVSGRVPAQRTRIESLLDGGFHNLKVRRNIEVAWRKQTVVPDVKDFFINIFAVRILRLFEKHLGKYRIADRLKGFRNQRRANCFRWIAAANGERQASPTTGDRRIWY